jgi:hypothetical protein
MVPRRVAAGFGGIVDMVTFTSNGKNSRILEFIRNYPVENLPEVSHKI